MQAARLCPHPLGERDAAALIGILATLSGHSMVGQLGDDFREALERRMVRDGLLAQPASSAGLQDALGDLVERLRCALGEYDSPMPTTQQ